MMESDRHTNADPDPDAGDSLAEPVSLGYDVPLEMAADHIRESVSTVRRLTERGALPSTGSGADERWFSPSLDDLVAYKEEKATYERRGHRNKLKRLLDSQRGHKYELVLWQAERERNESPD